MCAEGTSLRARSSHSERIFSMFCVSRSETLLGILMIMKQGPGRLTMTEGTIPSEVVNHPIAQKIDDVMSYCKKKISPDVMSWLYSYDYVTMILEFYKFESDQGFYLKICAGFGHLNKSDVSIKTFEVYNRILNGGLAAPIRYRLEPTENESEWICSAIYWSESEHIAIDHLDDMIDTVRIAASYGRDVMGEQGVEGFRPFPEEFFTIHTETRQKKAS